MEDDSHYTLAHYMGRHLAWFGFAQILVQVQLWHYVDVLAPQLSVRALWILCILCNGFGCIPYLPDVTLPQIFMWTYMSVACNIVYLMVL